MEYPPREVELLRHLHHPNIAELYDIIVTEDKTYLVTELAAGGLGDSKRLTQLLLSTKYTHPCHHPDVYSLCFFFGVFLWVVKPSGELFDYVTQKDKLTETEARAIFRQLLSAVDYMHRRGICHR